MNNDAKVRLSWIKLYQRLNHTSKVCDHFGISRFTLRMWVKCYSERGNEGLQELSGKPHNSPASKIDNKQKEIIISLRKDRKLGTRRIQGELKRLYQISLSLGSIHKVIKKNMVYHICRRKDIIAKQLSVIIVKFLVQEFRWMFARLHLDYINTRQLMIAPDTKFDSNYCRNLCQLLQNKREFY